jgi:hypothetical protein
MMHEADLALELLEFGRIFVELNMVDIMLLKVTRLGKAALADFTFVRTSTRVRTHMVLKVTNPSEVFLAD